MRAFKSQEMECAALKFYLEDLADLGVEVVEEVRDGVAGSRAEDV